MLKGRTMVEDEPESEDETLRSPPGSASPGPSLDELLSRSLDNHAQAPYSSDEVRAVKSANSGRFFAATISGALATLIACVLMGLAVRIVTQDLSDIDLELVNSPGFVVLVVARGFALATLLVTLVLAGTLARVLSRPLHIELAMRHRGGGGTDGTSDAPTPSTPSKRARDTLKIVAGGAVGGGAASALFGQ